MLNTSLLEFYRSVCSVNYLDKIRFRGSWVKRNLLSVVIISRQRFDVQMPDESVRSKTGPHHRVFAAPFFARLETVICCFYGSGWAYRKMKLPVLFLDSINQLFIALYGTYIPIICVVEKRDMIVQSFCQMPCSIDYKSPNCNTLMIGVSFSRIEF
jgi:hypothetical protein